MPVNRKWRFGSVKGVTFVEASVFISVVAVILTALLFSVFSLYRYRVVSSTMQQVSFIVERIRSVHVGQARVDRTLNEKTLALAGGFPPDMIVLPVGSETPLGKVQVFNSWGGKVHVSSETIYTRDDAFSLSYEGVPSLICRPLLIHLTAQGRDSGLVGVETFVTGTSAFPLDQQTVTRICEAQPDGERKFVLTYLLEK